MAQSKQAKAQGLGRYVIPLMTAAALLLIATVGIFSYVAYVDHNRLQWRLATNQLERLVPDLMSDAVRASTGNVDAATALQAKIIIFNASLDVLKNGKKSEGMPPLKADFSPQLDAVFYNWDKVRPGLE
ncbi:MAG TPA: hypothetical protein ENO09_03140, partial [bacterium]|nr:hypothetical protein [bacterium]